MDTPICDYFSMMNTKEFVVHKKEKSEIGIERKWEGRGGGGCSLLCKQFKFFVLGMLSLHSFAYR
jgi:hypothetical protein